MDSASLTTGAISASVLGGAVPFGCALRFGDVECGGSPSLCGLNNRQRFVDCAEKAISRNVSRPAEKQREQAPALHRMARATGQPS